MKYRKTINQMNRQRQIEEMGLIEEDHEHKFRREEHKRPIRNWKKAFNEHLEDYEDIDEFFEK